MYLGRMACKLPVIITVYCGTNLIRHVFGTRDRLTTKRYDIQVNCAPLRLSPYPARRLDSRPSFPATGAVDVVAAAVLPLARLLVQLDTLNSGRCSIAVVFVVSAVVACAGEWIDDAQDCCIHQYPAVGLLEFVTLLYRGFNSVSIMYIFGCYRTVPLALHCHIAGLCSHGRKQ
jgi:hypothetical protein